MDEIDAAAHLRSVLVRGRYLELHERAEKEVEPTRSAAAVALKSNKSKRAGVYLER